MADVKDVQIEESWKAALAEEFQKEYFQNIKQFLLEEKVAGKTIYPPGKLIFNAFNKVPIQKLKVVILGQDPYHGPGQAHGLSFSVPYGVKAPPSLKRVFKELETDIEGFETPNHGNLESWAEQGVFLLNAALTVEHKKANAHAKIGWHQFTDQVIKTISEQCEGVVFMLWGGFAKKKASLIDADKHLVLEAAHPSPFTRDAWFGNQHFSQANAYLEQQGKTPIDWRLKPLA